MDRLLIEGPRFERGTLSCRKLDLNPVSLKDGGGERSRYLEAQQRLGVQFNLPTACERVRAQAQCCAAGGSDRCARSSSGQRADDGTGCGAPSPALATVFGMWRRAIFKFTIAATSGGSPSHNFPPLLPDPAARSGA